MACVPPRAGFESARKFPIARGVPLSHCKMKQLLARSSMWHRTCRGWPPASNVRNMVSQAIVVEEMEAVEASEASEKKAVHRQRWQAHETMALIAAKKQQDLMGMESTEAAGIETKKTKNKWKEVEAFCQEKGVERSAQQCQTRWSRLLSAFTQIRSWEETRKPEQPSFWSLKLDERKTLGFLVNLDQKTYNALDEFFNTKADAIENVFVNNSEVAESGSVKRMSHGVDGKKYNANEADVNLSRVQGKSDEIKNMTNSHSSSFKSDEMVHTKGLNISKPNVVKSYERDIRDDDFHLEELEECSGENHVDQCKAMENTKILSEFLLMAMDDRNDDQLPHASTGKTDLKPTKPTGQQVEKLKASGIANHSNQLILCDQEDVNVKALLLPAGEEMIDGSNKESCRVPLVVVDDCSKAQLPHVSAENMDCNPSNLHTDQHAESLKYSGKGEHIISKSRCDQRDAYDKTEFLPASVEMVDGTDRVSCKGSLEEHGDVEKVSVMHGDDDNVSLSGVMHDEIAQAAHDECIEKGADGILFKTNAFVIDSLVEEGIASVSAAVEESCKCQNSKSHLSFTGVDVLNANQSTLTTPLSHISADKDDCQNYSEYRILVEEAWVGKEAKGEGDEVNAFLCPKNSEDISTALADSSQSNVIEAQIENDACQMFEHQGKLDPVLDFKEEIGTGILEQLPQDNSTLPISENIESRWSDQDKEFEKFEICLPEEGHTEMIADVTERNVTTLECGAGHSFVEKKAEQLQTGNNEFNEKTSEPSRSIKHFEAAVKDMDLFVNSELCDQKQSDHENDGNDAFERPKVTTEEGGWVVGIGVSKVDTNPPALTSIDHQVQHAPEQKSTTKGDAGSVESVSEASRVEVAANEPTKLEFIVKDERGTAVTAEKGSVEDCNQKTSARSPADEDVFMNIPAATGSLVKSALQTIRKFFKF